MRNNKHAGFFESSPVRKTKSGGKETDSKLMDVDISAMSQCGKVRPTNGDCYLVARLDRTLQVLSTNVPERLLPAPHSKTVYGMLVADGMGAAPAGAVASSTAISVPVDLVTQTPDWIMQLDESTSQQVLKRASQRLRQLEEAFDVRVQVDPSLTGMGTTMTVACSYGSKILVSHVGQSRAYLFHDD